MRARDRTLARVTIDVDRYLARIGYGGSRQPTAEVLAALQLAHLQTVPFENLHVFHRVGVRVDVEWSFAKIVDGGRGGWCFELNGCFAALLEVLGFDVDRLSCRTFDPATGALSPAFDHLALLVRTGGERYLVDVGWGDNPLTPVAAEPGEDASMRPRPVRIEADDGAVRLVELVERTDGTTVWEPQYEAAWTPRRLADFHDRNVHLQTSPDSVFTQKPVVTRATSARGGRVTLHRDRLRLRDDDLGVVDTVVSAEAWPAVLDEHFAMTVPVRSAG